MEGCGHLYSRACCDGRGEYTGLTSSCYVFIHFYYWVQRMGVAQRVADAMLCCCCCQSPSPVLPAHAQIGNALIRLGKELDARMLFLVNNSRENLDDFLYHSITGHCTQEGVCATVVLHPPYEKGMQHTDEDAYLP